MKVIRLGKLPQDEWIGVQGTCSNCKMVIEIEHPEEVRTTHDQRDGDYSWVTCPLCGKPIAVSKTKTEAGFTH